MAAEFGVSGMTIRRDIETLCSTGQVLRIPGGARIGRGILAEKPFLERLQRRNDDKARIGKLAASLILEGESVVLDSGTTTLHIARNLRERACTVITFSVAVLQELAGSRTVRVELTGGAYRASSHDLIGPAVNETLGSIRADKVFFGAAAVSWKNGIMVNDPEAPRALLQSGRERILIADSSKFGQDALYRFCGLDDCEMIVTDCGVRTSELEKCRKHVKVLTAK